MAQIRFKGFQTGENLGLVTATVGAETDSTTIAAFQSPSVQTALPTISDANDTETLTPDDNGITVTTRIWRNATTLAVLGSGATLSAAGLAGEYVEYSPDNGTTWSPPLRVYPTTMMGTPMMASHIADDTAVLALIPHNEATHIAVADGNWSTPSTWNTGTVPRSGAVVLIPHPRVLTYDWNEFSRLDRVRVDGTLNWPVDQSTQMLVESLIVTRGGVRTMGTGGGNRVQDGVTHTITISGKDYSANSYTPTDIKAATFSTTRGWGRGIINMGEDTIWGRKATGRAKATAEVGIGATSLTVDRDLTGIEVGHEILISGMDIDYAWSNGPHSPIYQYERRVLTGVSGRVLSWATPLVNNHGNTLTGSTRTDLVPTIMFLGTKNVIQQSEVTSPTWRRGHYANMHGGAAVDVWGLECKDMGRTDKSRASGIIDSNGDFDSRDVIDRTQVALTPQANLQGRYAFHAHHTGLTPNSNLYAECHGDGTPGWMFVHHSSRVDMLQNTGIGWYAGFMVGEQGNELGAWTDNYGAASSWEASEYGDGNYTNLDVNYKTLEGAQGPGGDPFRQGQAYGLRGRALVSNGNWASDCPISTTFNSRTLAPEGQIVPGLGASREQADLKELGQINGDAIDLFDLEWIITRYPIIHFADNEDRAVVQGVSVVKPVWVQKHDGGIRIKRHKSYGYRNYAFEVEYVNKYMIEDVDAVTGAIGDAAGNGGLAIGANAHALGYVNARVEGGNTGVFVDRSDLSTHGDNYTPDDPRYFLTGLETIDVNNEYLAIDGTPPQSLSFEATSFLDDDFDATLIDYTVDPSETYPLIMADFDGTTMTNMATNSDGSKIDNLSSVGKIFPAPLATEAPFPVFDGTTFVQINYTRWMQVYGYWQYNSQNVIAIPLLFSDRLSARPAKTLKLINYTGSTAGLTDNGALTIAGSAVVRAEMTATCSVNGSAVIDWRTGCSGGDGSTYEVDTTDLYQADHGRFTVDNAAGTITYTPFIDYEGLDEIFIVIKSGNRYKTVRIAMYVGSLSAATAPTISDFTVTGGAGSIDVALSDRPDDGGRGIKLVQYSTDGGTTWRRLCNHWIKATHTITTESDGTALAAGSVNVRIRYRDRYTYTDTAASADRSATVT